MDSLLALVEPQGAVARAVLQFPENEWCRQFGRAGAVDPSTQMGDPDAPLNAHIALSFSPSPKDLSKGFVFGSDAETCDVLLATDKTTGVSGNHFSIHVDWPSGNPLIKCLSPDEGTGIRVLSDDGWVLQLRGKCKVVKPGTATAFKISEYLKFVVRNPVRVSREPAYSINLQQYFIKCRDAVPEMASLRLYDGEPTPLLLTRGRGLFGDVYFTTSTFIGDKVVLCEAESHNGANQKLIVKRFRTVKRDWPYHANGELKSLQALRHRHIITPHDIISDGSEFLPVYLPEPPETLATRNRIEHFTETDTGEVLAQVFEGLKFLHSHKIVHGCVCPDSIKIENASPWSIKLSDIGLHPYVSLENARERALYASQPGNGRPRPTPVWDTWSAGVVGFKLLRRSGLPYRSGALSSQINWVKAVVFHAEHFLTHERPGSRQDAAGFITRVLKVEFSERLTAEECLQDPWMHPFLSHVQDPNKTSEARLRHRQLGVEDGSDEDTKTNPLPSAMSKGKRPQNAAHNSIVSPTSTIPEGGHPDIHYTHPPPRISDVISRGNQLETRWNSMVPRLSTSISNGKQPERPRHTSVTAPISSGISKAKPPQKSHHTSSASSSNQHRQRSLPPQSVPSDSHTPTVIGFTPINRPANTTRQRSDSPSAKFYQARAGPSGTR